MYAQYEISAEIIENNLIERVIKALGEKLQ